MTSIQIPVGGFRKSKPTNSHKRGSVECLVHVWETFRGSSCPLALWTHTFLEIFSVEASAILSIRDQRIVPALTGPYLLSILGPALLLFAVVHARSVQQQALRGVILACKVVHTLQQVLHPCVGKQNEVLVSEGEGGKVQTAHTEEGTGQLVSRAALALPETFPGSLRNSTS